MEKTIDVLAVGNAIVDVFSTCDDDFLDQQSIGKGMMNLVDAERSAALYADLGQSEKMSGGSAANTAVGIAALGGAAAFAGRVHDDPLGHAFCDDIKNASVAFNNPPHVNGSPTASSIILITPDAIRSMNTYLGACIEFQPEDILCQDAAAAKIIYLEGYLFDAPAGPAIFARAAALA
ncbi:MAG: PfkB family carbohydrate kinase, partial [Candidatus Puniceispirillaceae bacterium]